MLSVQIISALAKFAEAGSVIQFLIAADASAFQFYQGKAYVSGLHGGDISRFVGKNGANNGSPSQIVLRAVAEVGRTAEQRDHAGKMFKRLSVLPGRLQFGACFLFRGGLSGVNEQFGT